MLSALLWLAACAASPSRPFTRAGVLEQLRDEYPRISLPEDALPAGVVARENLAYLERDAGTLALDLYRPGDGSTEPAVIVVHGGGWERGDRSMERPLAKRLAGLGYVAVPVSYRLGREGRYPNALFDLKAAVRWLRAHAEQFAIDAGHIGAIGGSSGGQLVALLGATNGQPGFEDRAVGSAAAPGSSSVQAVVDIDGLVDFTAPALLDKERRQPGAPVRFLGGPYTERDAVWKQASALGQLSPNSAPTLFIDSTSPTPILPGRAEMCAQLRALGIDSELVVMPNTPHPFWLVNPWFEPTLFRAERFLKKHLKP